MRKPTCPRCGAPRDEHEPQPLARCGYCGALLSSPAVTERPLQARPRLDPAAARGRAARGRQAVAEPARAGEPTLVFYPFVVQPSTRRPLRPLAPLPPALAADWRASGADLVFDDPGERNDAASDDLARTASRVPISEDPPGEADVVFHPFYRVPIEVEGRADAVWVDAVSGQLLTGRRNATATTEAAPGIDRWVGPALAAGLASGLLLPFPLSLVPAGGAAAFAWHRAARP